MHKNKKNNFGEERLIFFSVRNLEHRDIASVESQREKKIAEEKDEEGRVTKKGNEAATWTVNELFAKSNATINKRRDALSELSDVFNQRLHSAIVTYIKDSPGRFESDEFKGLSNKEYERYSTSMTTKVSELVEQYAPTAEEIAAKKEAQSTLTGAKEAAKEVKDIEVKDIPEDPGPINDLRVLSDKMAQFSGWNDSIRKDGGEISKGMGDFQKQYAAFKKARAGARAYKKFADFLTSDDNMKDLQAIKNSLQTRIETAIKKIKEGQERLDKYGKKMAEASNRQKQEKIKERDKELKRIEDDEKLSEEEKEKKKATYDLLKEQKTKLDGQRYSLEQYHDGLIETRSAKVERELSEDEKRKGQLEFYNLYLSHSVGEIDKLLQNPEISGTVAQQLQETRAQIAEKQEGGRLATIHVEAKITGGTEIWDKLTREERVVAENTTKIDTHIQNDVIPTMTRLDQHIGLLDQSLIQYTDSKREVMDHYEKAFKQYDIVDAAVDDAVLQQGLANAQMIGQMERQSTALGQMTLENTSFYQATAGAVFGTLGGALMGVAEGMINNADIVDKELKMVRDEGGGPARYWAGKIGLEVMAAPMGALAGAFEIVGGLSTMIGDPVAAANGVGTLIGRDQNTGEWGLGTAWESWKGMLKAITSYEHFEKGQVGVGFGKIFTNVVSIYVTGGGSALIKGVQGATAAGRTAALASVKASAKALQAQGVAMGLKGPALKTFIRSGLESARWQASLAATMPAAKEFGRAIMDDIVDSVVAGAKETYHTPQRAFEAGRAAPAIIRRAASAAYEMGPRGIMRNFADDLASRSTMAEKLFGKEAATRGLSRRNRQLLDEIAQGSGKVKKFNQLLDDLRKKHPRLSEAEIRLKLRRRDPILFDEVARIERKLGQAMETNMRLEGNYHTDVDQLSGMRRKQMLYTREGMEYLSNKFGDEVNMVFGDVTGMGIGNRYLHGPGEGAAHAMSNVDEMFKMMKEVADDVFRGRPIEVVRFGGDEIIFLTRKADAALMDDFFRLYNERKQTYLSKKIGEPAYQRAKYETNVKAQQKLIDKDPEYFQALNGGEEALQAYFTKHLGKEGVEATSDLASMNRLLAEKRLAAIAREKWLEPLDFYRAPEKTVRLTGKRAHEQFMRQLAEADADIAWSKAQPGRKPPQNRTYGDDVAKAHGDYLTEARFIEENGARIKELQGQLRVAEQLGDQSEVVNIQRQITVLRAKDPGTGAIRLDNGKYIPMDELMPIPKDTKDLHVMKIDVNYFGAYNNNYWMSKADEMMTRLKEVAEKAYGGEAMVIRDGGTFYLVSKQPPVGTGFPRMHDALSDAIRPYAEGLGSVERRSALRLEMERKMRAGDSSELPGTVKISEAQAIRLEEGNTLMEMLGRYDSHLEASAKWQPQPIRTPLENIPGNRRPPTSKPSESAAAAPM